MDYNHIRKLAQDFISESMYKEDPTGLCFTTSFSLLIYLATKQIKSCLRKGEFPKLDDNGKFRKIPHFWLQIDAEGTILDPTYTQFVKDKNIDPIYIGKLQDCKVTKQYKQCDVEIYIWFPKIFDSWKDCYIYSTFPLDGSFEKRSIAYTLKLASILHFEIKKMSSPDEFINQYFELYFEPIYIFLCNWQSGKINFYIEKEKFPNGFDNLLSEAIKWEKNGFPAI